MGLFSRILVVLNIIAAAAFIYLAGSVWGKRQEWTYAVFQHTVALNGLPLEGEAGEGDTLPFDYQVTDPVRLDSIRKSTLEKLIPKGGNEFGGDVVNSQTAEIVRVQKKVLALVDGADGAAAKRNLLLKYLINLASTGAHRDGAFALLRDLFNKDRAENARLEVGLLARTPLQVDSLKALASLGDKASGGARRVLIDLLKSAAPLGISGDTADARADSERNIINGVDMIVKAASTEAVDHGPLAEGKRKLLESIRSETVKSTIGTVADLLDKPLSDETSLDNARKSLRDVAVSSARSESEKVVLGDLADLLLNKGEGLETQAIAAGRAVLQQYFDEAASPSTPSKEATAKGIFEANQKARQIAHILYFLDSDKPDFAARWDWQQRVIRIVGMKLYVDEANTQALALAEMSQRLKGIIREEEANFRADYLNQIRIALEQADQLGGLTLELNGLQNQKANSDVNLSERAKERENLERNLEENKASAKRFLQVLADREKELFQLLNELKDSKDSLEKLERQIRGKEREISTKTPNDKGRE